MKGCFDSSFFTASLAPMTRGVGGFEFVWPVRSIPWWRRTSISKRTLCPTIIFPFPIKSATRSRTSSHRDFQCTILSVIPVIIDISGVISIPGSISILRSSRLTAVYLSPSYSRPNRTAATSIIRSLVVSRPVVSRSSATNVR